MTLTDKEIKNWVTHLINDSKEAYAAAQDLYKSKRYHFALFFCHLSLEKIIKAYFLAEKSEFAPPVHDLIYIIKKVGINLNHKTQSQLNEINSFNLRARYEDYKREFYKKADVKYTRKWMNIVEDLLLFFLQKI